MEVLTLTSAGQETLANSKAHEPQINPELQSESGPALTDTSVLTGVIVDTG